MKKLFILIILLASLSAVAAQDTPAKPNFKDYTGTYTTDNEFIGKVTVKIEKEKLSAIISSGEEFLFEHVKGDEFFISAESISIVFTRNKDKQITGFISVSSDGNEIKGTKLKEVIDLTEYTGEYWAEGKETPLTVKVENGVLIGSTGGERWFELKRIKGDDFEVEEVSAGIIFTRDKDKKVDGVKVVEPGGTEVTAVKSKK